MHLSSKEIHAKRAAAEDREIERGYSNRTETIQKAARAVSRSHDDSGAETWPFDEVEGQRGKHLSPSSDTEIRTALGLIAEGILRIQQVWGETEGR